MAQKRPRIVYRPHSAPKWPAALVKYTSDCESKEAVVYCMAGKAWWPVAWPSWRHPTLDFGPFQSRRSDLASCPIAETRGTLSVDV